MRIAYVAPSALPSRAANAVHVALQCEGLARAGAEVTLYAKRGVEDAERLPAVLSETYGIDPRAMQLVTCFSAGSRGDTLRIAAMAVPRISRSPQSAVLSRNLYAAFALGVVQKRRILFETHQLEYGLRGTLQRMIMNRPWVTTVVISDALVKCLEEHHGAGPRNPLVAHDAAPEGIECVHPDARRERLRAVWPQAQGEWQLACGYFGHLYAGRGVEIVEAMAAARPHCLFLLFGGNEAEIARRRAANRHANLHYLGHVPHPVVRSTLGLFDVLLMPYQQSVSIGVAGHDTARWMSPMKMFEYLASGVPVVASDMPALREILHDGRNSLLVAPDRVDQWVGALDRLAADRPLAAAIGAEARARYLAEGTWTHRARHLLDAAAGA